MRNRINCITIAIYIALVACNEHTTLQDKFDLKQPIITEAKYYKVDVKKMPPKVIPATGIKKVLAGKPEVITLASNVFEAHATIIKCNPITDTVKKNYKEYYRAPLIIPEKDTSFIAGIPEVTVVDKDFYMKDENPESFSSMGVAHGLKYAEVNALCKDKAGSIWIATWDGGGISKYDGRMLTNYSVEQGLSSEHAFSLMEDRDNNIWIGTDHSSVNKFDGRRIMRFDIGFGMTNNFVLNMIQDKKRNIWLCTVNGLIKFDGKFFTQFTTAQGLSGNGVSCVYEDSKNNLWVGAQKGIFKLSGNKLENYNNVFKLSANLETSGEVKNILEDSKHNLWIGTNNDGLYKCNDISTMHFNNAGGLSSNTISGIKEDSKGNIWIATADSGLNKFDGKFFTHYNSKQGLTSEVIYALIMDDHNTLWMGTSAGINKHEGELFSHIQEIQRTNNEVIVCLHTDNNSNIWIGGRSSLSKYDGKSITKYTSKQGLKNNAVTDILQDTLGNIWSSSWMGGITKFDGKYFTNVTTENGLIDDDVIAMLQSKKGDLWIATNGGVSKFDGKLFTNYTSKNGLISDDINSLFEDGSGNIWFGSRDKGLSKFDGNYFTNYNINIGLGGTAVTCIAEDRLKHLWLGTNNGLIEFDGNNFIHYNSEQGLSGKIVTNLLFAKNGNLWIGTNSGLNRFANYKNDSTYKTSKSFSRFKKFTSADGFSGIWSYYKTMAEDVNGDILIGAWDRITKFHPQNDITDTVAPTINLSSISLFDEEINWSKISNKQDSDILLSNGVRIKNFHFNSLSSWYNQPENLQLAYNNNYLTFHFVGITTNRSNEVRYQYFLDGLDNNWSAIISDPEATYNNLPPGHYTFKVKAANSDSYWSNELNYSFTILPPWWQTWWAYVLYTVAFLSVLALYIKRREKILKKETAKLEQKVASRTNELQAEKEKVESSLAQVKKLQAQLVETEKINERLRISQELHDDIGGTLSGIVLYSHLAADQVHKKQTSDAEKSLNMIQNSANGMVNKLSDIIWSVNPEHNSVKSLFEKLTEYATEMAAAKKIIVQVYSQDNLAKFSLPLKARHNVYLFFKEAINNAVKYSDASVIHLKTNSTDHDVEFLISDNGKGFDAAIVKSGNGLINMQKRANHINARFCLKSDNKGTTISLRCSLNAEL